MRLGRDEVIAPDVSWPFRPQPNARSIVQPQTTPWTLLLRHFKALTAPDALDPVLANLPATGPQQRSYPAVAVAPVLGRQGDNGLGQHILVSPDRRDIALGSPRLADDPASMAFRQPILLLDRLNRLPASIGRYKFPSATSLRICFSSDRSATSRFSRAFSRSSSLNRLACSISRPPYSLRQR